MLNIVLGNADARSSIYLASTVWGGWITIYGIGVFILLLIPRVLFTFKSGGEQNVCKYKWMNVVEKIGGYATVFFIVVPIGVKVLGFSSIDRFLVYVLGNILLLLVDWILWILYFKKQSKIKAMLLAILPATIFLLTCLMLGHLWLILSASIFGIGRYLVTYYRSIPERMKIDN